MVTRTRQALLTAASALALGGCNAMLGLDPSEPYPDAAMDAADESSGDSGSDANADAPEEASFTQCGAFKNMAAPCASCTDSKCCVEANECRSDAVCATVFDCIAACENEDATCRATCFGQSLDGLATAKLSLESCQATSCRDECNPCGGFYNAFRETCAPCMQNKCCDTTQACADFDECLAIVQCYEHCLDPSCVEQCGKGMPTAASLSQGAFQCMYDHCQDECFGGNWKCVGKYTWPAPQGSTADVTFYLLNPLDKNSPVPGATISACDIFDPNCEKSGIITADTGPNGFAKLKGIAIPFTGFFRVTKAGLLTTTNFFAHPIIGDVDLRVLALPESVKSTLETLIGKTLDPARGHILPVISDCATSNSPGIQFKLAGNDTATAIYSAEDGTPIKSLTETTNSSQAIFVNAELGTVQIDAVVASTQQKVASMNVLVQPGIYAVAVMLPNPK